MHMFIPLTTTMKKAKRLLLLATCLGLVSMLNWNSSYPGSGTVTVMLVLAALCCVDMSRLSPAESAPLPCLILQYLLILAKRTLGVIQHHYLMDLLKNPSIAQNQVLLAILGANKDTEFGQKWNFSSIWNKEEYVNCLPLNDYDSLQGDIQRMVAGEQNILLGGHIDFLAMTAGTTGKSKVFPITNHHSVSFSKITLALPLATLNLKRISRVILYGDVKFSPGGVAMGALCLHQKPWTYDVIPKIRTQISDESTSFHVQAVFLLRERDLGIMEIYSSHLAGAFFTYIELNWNLICDDIYNGELRNNHNIDHEIFEELNLLLKPDEQRARELRPLIQDGADGLVKRIWPGIDAVMMARSGGFLKCAETVMSSYLKDVCVTYHLHFATEGPIGVRYDEDVQRDIYLLLPNIVFLEFIAVSDIWQENPPTLFVEQLQVGETYEVVLTTHSGLYRYRLGDIIKVVDYLHQTPRYQILHRKEQLLAEYKKRKINQDDIE